MRLVIAQLFVDGAQAVGDGIDGIVEQIGNVLIVRTAGDQPQNRHLAFRQRLAGGCPRRSQVELAQHAGSDDRVDQIITPVYRLNRPRSTRWRPPT